MKKIKTFWCKVEVLQLCYKKQFFLADFTNFSLVEDGCWIGSVVSLVRCQIMVFWTDGLTLVSVVVSGWTVDGFPGSTDLGFVSSPFPLPAEWALLGLLGYGSVGGHPVCGDSIWSASGGEQRGVRRPGWVSRTDLGSYVDHPGGTEEFSPPGPLPPSVWSSFSHHHVLMSPTCLLHVLSFSPLCPHVFSRLTALLEFSEDKLKVRYVFLWFQKIREDRREFFSLI